LEKKFSTALSQEAEVGVKWSRVAGQPGQHLWMFVGGLVVEHGMDNPASRDLALNGVEKADEFAVAVTPHAAADDGTIEHAERREQAGGAVPLIVKRLDLALFVDRQHHGMGLLTIATLPRTGRR